MKNKLSKKGYMCSVDYTWELGEAVGGSIVYPSIEDLKEHHNPWDSCGIVEVEVSQTNIIHKQNLKKEAMSEEEYTRQERELRVKWYEQVVENLEAELEDKRKRLNKLKKEI